MSGQPDSRPQCGNCLHFDTKRADGSQVDDGNPQAGYCRTMGRTRGIGLLFGVLPPETPCKQDLGVFRPRSARLPT